MDITCVWRRCAYSHNANLSKNHHVAIYDHFVSCIVNIYGSRDIVGAGDHVGDHMVVLGVWLFCILHMGADERDRKS